MSLNTEAVEPYASDLTDSSYAARRLKRAFVQRPVQPVHGIQYRLAEVGPRRFDPRVLLRLMPSVLNGKHDVTEYLPFVYGLSDLSPHEERTATERVVSTLRELAQIDWNETTDVLTRTVGHAFKSHEIAVDHWGDASRTPIGNGLTLPRVSRTIRAESPAGGEVLCWITNELEWIYPDDPRLWQLLIASAKTAAFPLVVARKIAPATFAVLRALDARGSQFYGVVVPDATATALDGRLDEIGWPYLVRAKALQDHEFMLHLATLVEDHIEADQFRPNKLARTAIELAEAHAFHSDAASPSLLAQWARDSELPIPERWFDGIKNWDSNARMLPPSKPSRASNAGRAQRPQHEDGNGEGSQALAPTPFGRTTKVSRVPIRVW